MDADGRDGRRGIRRHVPAGVSWDFDADGRDERRVTGGLTTYCNCSIFSITFTLDHYYYFQEVWLWLSLFKVSGIGSWTEI